MVSIPEAIEKRIKVAEALASGECGGTYYEAALILTGLLSGLASDLWPGERIDRQRFVELCVRFGEPSLGPFRISVPLLTQDLSAQGQQAEANELIRRRPLAAPGSSVVATSTTVDVEDEEILSWLPGISRHLVRRWSYANILYKHIRSPLVHEYNIPNEATAWSLADPTTEVNYINMIAGTHHQTRFKRIHLPLSWIASLIRTVTKNAESALLSAPKQRPATWWLNS